MKNVKKMLIAILMVFLMVFTLPVMSNITETMYTVEAASVKINKSKYTMNVGEKYTLKMKGTKKKVKWSTSNKKVATVNSKGKVTAKKKGTATITAKVGNKKYKCKIKVEKPTINKNSKTLNVGEKYTLKIKGTSQKVKWSTSNKKVATVNSKGKVTAKKKGTATITAKVGNKKIKAKIKVTEKVNENEYDNSFDKLSKYIENYGYINKDGNYVYSYTYNSNYKFYMLYDDSANKIRFCTIYAEGSALSTFVTDMKKSSSGSVQLDCIFTSTREWMRAKATVNPNKIKLSKNNIDFTLTGNTDTDISQEYANTMLDLSVVAWEKYLLTNSGVSLKDFSFNI